VAPGRNNCQSLFDFNFLNKSLKQGLAEDIFKMWLALSVPGNGVSQNLKSR
jgi:hypothetical protein